MQKDCRHCSVGFEVGDLEFYKRISPKLGGEIFEVATPSLCAECRNFRRQIFRNDRSFYKRKCDSDGREFISMYPAEVPYKVFHPDNWYSDKWNPMDYGREFDFGRPFFEQFAELMVDVPRLGIDIVNCENSYYCNYCGDDKNCYLDIAGEANEDSYYNLFVKYSRNVVDCTFVYNSELCYECINSYDCYGCQHSMYLENCSDCVFCFDLKGCKNCLFSSGLRNKEYYIFNKPYSREEYEKYVGEIGLGNFAQREKLKGKWEEFKREHTVFRDSYFLNCENCSGNNLRNCKNVFDSYNALNSEDCRNLHDVLDATDCRDLNYSLYKPELAYELISTLAMVHSAFSMASHHNHDVYYCDLTNNSGNLFGCIGLNHKEYCVLNKQYSRYEYEELVGRIIVYMKETGEWGEFFPASISPFTYKQTVASEYFDLSREEVEAREARYGDDVAGRSDFKIIEQERDFYERMGIPEPGKSPNERHMDRMRLRNPRRLFDRQCSKCGKGVRSSFEAERPEKVYCQECYLAEVY